jgi:hypothetical protein
LGSSLANASILKKEEATDEAITAIDFEEHYQAAFLRLASESVERRSDCLKRGCCVLTTYTSIVT